MVTNRVSSQAGDPTILEGNIWSIWSIQESWPLAERVLGRARVSAPFSTSKMLVMS